MAHSRRAGAGETSSQLVLEGPRAVALQVLLDCQGQSGSQDRRNRSQDSRPSRGKTGFVQEHLDRRLSETSLAAVDRRLATQLVYGVLRRRLTLNALVQPLISRPAHKVESWLWEVLYLGAYQLIFLDQVPAHAALHETVELSVRMGRPGAKGFINGILRALTRLLTSENTSSPAADAIPLEGGQYRHLNRPILPDPATSPLDYLSLGFGLPAWLVERWLQRLGEEECYRLGFWFASPASLTLRINRLKTSREVFLEELNQSGLSAEPGDHPQAVRFSEPVPIRQVSGYEAGWFTVQDESAMQVASALAPAPGSTVLDLCAAPGGKTTHLAEVMGDQGRILACDTDARRLTTIRTLANRLGLTCIETQTLQPGNEGANLPAASFDAVLVDAPCSNTGVLGRRPEIRWRLKPTDLKELVQVQQRLLHLAARCVRSGGVLVYSTCSIEPEENTNALLKASLPNFHLEAEAMQQPGLPADGGYWARLRKES